MEIQNNGQAIALSQIVNDSRNKLWDVLFERKQYADNEDLLAALIGSPGYIEFLTSPPNDENLSNMAGASGLPYDFGIDGFGIEVAHKDLYHDTVNQQLYTFKALIQEHGRLMVQIRGVTIYNGPVTFATLGVGLPAALSTTQTATTIASETHGAPHLSNYFRPGGPDPTMGILAREGQKVLARLYLDQEGQTLLTDHLDGESPDWEPSELGWQIMFAFKGWAFKYLA